MLFYFFASCGGSSAAKQNDSKTSFAAYTLKNKNKFKKLLLIS